MTAVRALSQDIGIRVAGTDGDRLARGMVVRGFRDAGWDVRLQVFDLPQGGTSANVVATRGGRGPDESHLVVGAHLDTVPDSPGANDNASGVGVLLSLAEELADEADRLEVPLVLVAFGAEEFQPGTDQHHLGSEAYAATHAGNVTGMLSVDMVGNGATTCICWFDAGPGTMAELLRDVAGEEDIGPVAVEQRGDISDHGPFALRGIPAAFLWTYRDGAYHTPADVFERVHPPDVARAGEIALALVRSYDAPPGP